MTNRALIVESDQFIAQRIQKTLCYQGMDVEIATNSIAGLEAVKRQLPDVVIINYCLIDSTGAEFCYYVKGTPATLTIPIIMLTDQPVLPARNPHFPTSMGDYCLPKNMLVPFALVELLRYLGFIPTMRATPAQVSYGT